MVAMKTSIKAKARKNVRALVNGSGLEPLGAPMERSLVLFGLLFRGRQAFEALQKLLLGHALDGNLGIISIDAGAGRSDQRHGIGLRLVNFDEFLQRMNQFFTQILG